MRVLHFAILQLFCEIAIHKKLPYSCHLRTVASSWFWNYMLVRHLSCCFQRKSELFDLQIYFITVCGRIEVCQLLFTTWKVPIFGVFMFHITHKPRNFVNLRIQYKCSKIRTRKTILLLKDTLMQIWKSPNMFAFI